MTNSLLAAPSDCTLDDLEIVYTGVREIYTVNEDGGSGDVKETDLYEAEFDYYFCTSCSKNWSKTMLQSQKQAWELAKEHLGEND